MKQYRTDIQEKVQKEIEKHVAFMGLKGSEACAFEAGAAYGSGHTCILLGIKDRVYDKNGKQIS